MVRCITTKSIVFHNKIELNRPQGIDYHNGVVAISNSRGYELKLFDLKKDKEIISLPRDKNSNILSGGVCMISDDLIYVTDIDKGTINKFYR